MEDKKVESKGIFDDDTPPLVLKLTEEEKEVEYKKDVLKIVLLSIIPIIIQVYCLMKCEGDFSEGGPGIVWIYYYAYIVFIGIGVMFYTLGLSIQAYKYKKNLISVLSIFISLTPIWTIGVQLLIEYISMQ